LRRRFASDLALHGDLVAAAGDPARAVENYREVLALLEADRARDPSDAQAARHVAVARIRVAAYLLALGGAAEGADAGELADAAEAVETVAPAVAELERMRAGDPGNAFLDFSLAEASLRLGQALARTGESAAARPRIALAVELLESLAAAGALTGTDAALLEEARAAMAPR
jgi:hypothetical protein